MDFIWIYWKLARCSEIHQKLTYHFPLGGVIKGLKINETKLVSTTIAGFIDKHGNKGTAFTSERSTWQDVIIQANFKIILTTGMAIVNNKEMLLYYQPIIHLNYQSNTS